MYIFRPQIQSLIKWLPLQQPEPNTHTLYPIYLHVFLLDQEEWLVGVRVLAQCLRLQLLPGLAGELRELLLVLVDRVAGVLAAVLDE